MKPRRYAVAIDTEGNPFKCEHMKEPIKDAPDTIEEGFRSIPTWVNLWASDEDDARERAVKMWREKRQ